MSFGDEDLKLVPLSQGYMSFPEWCGFWSPTSGAVLVQLPRLDVVETVCTRRCSLAEEADRFLAIAVLETYSLPWQNMPMLLRACSCPIGY
jgi:hypothetical protein